jgi:hypothetical protein
LREKEKPKNYKMDGKELLNEKMIWMEKEFFFDNRIIFRFS